MMLSTPDGASINLQATLSASSAVAHEKNPVPHHPCTCNGRLYFTEDNRFGCEHVEVPADDPRTQSCVNHSISILIFEVLHDILNPKGSDEPNNELPFM